MTRMSFYTIATLMAYAPVLGSPESDPPRRVPRVIALAWQGVDKAGKPCLLCDRDPLTVWAPAGEPMPDVDLYERITEDLRQAATRCAEPNSCDQGAVIPGPRLFAGRRCLHVWIWFPDVDEQSDPSVSLTAPGGQNFGASPGMLCRERDARMRDPALRVFSIPLPEGAQPPPAGEMTLRYAAGEWILTQQQIFAKITAPVAISPWGTVTAAGPSPGNMGQPESFLTFAGDRSWMPHIQFGFGCVKKDGTGARWAGWRLTAAGREGRHGELDCLFEGPFEKVAYFCPQWRPIQTVTFKGVSLEAGRETKTVTEVFDREIVETEHELESFGPTDAPPDSHTASSAPAGAPEDPRVEALFQKLRDNSRDIDRYVRDKWERMNPIEQAQLVNRWSDQGKGPDWKPNEKEAEAFVLEQLGYAKPRLMNMELPKGKRSKQAPDSVATHLADSEFRQQPRLEKFLDWMAAFLSPDEKWPFQAREDSLLNELATLGQIDALLVRTRNPGRDKPYGQGAKWAAEALVRMGEAAVPATSAEIGRCIAQRSRWSGADILVGALMHHMSPAAVPVLRGILKTSVPSVGRGALFGLANFPYGMTQEMLLEAYQTQPSIRDAAARLLGERGDEKAISVLQRDLPTAFARARYDAEFAIWNIRSRLRLEPSGPRPDPPTPSGQAMRETERDWEGWEKSIHAPNKAIRLEAVEHLGRLAERDEARLQDLIALARTDPDPEVRLKAAELLAGPLYLHAGTRQHAGQSLDPVTGVFDALAQLAIKGDDDFLASVAAPPLLQLFKDRPAFGGLLVRILDGLASQNVSCRAACLDRVTDLASRDSRILQLASSPERKPALLGAVMQGLASDDQRYRFVAMTSAGLWQVTEAVPALIAVTRTGTDMDRCQAAYALEHIKDPRTLDALEKMAQTDPYVDPNGRTNRDFARKAIEKIRERQTTKP